MAGVFSKERSTASAGFNRWWNVAGALLIHLSIGEAYASSVINLPPPRPSKDKTAMKQQLIECVPNFSEGNDMSVIKQITSEIEGVEGVKLLDVDPGKATNRTVVTFVGTPPEVITAAVRAAGS